MIKKTVTYKDYNDPPQEITEDFYFSYDQMEIIELLHLFGLEEKIRQLQTTANTEEAYNIFKKLILDAYGKKTEGGRGFDKSPPVKAYLMASPALSKIVVEFVKDPKAGAEFLAATLPEEDIAAAKAEMERMEKENLEKSPELPTAPPVLEETGSREKTFSEYTRQELIDMSDDDFQKLIPKNVRDMSKHVLSISMERKNRE